MDYSNEPRGRRLYATKYIVDEEKKSSIIKWKNGPLQTTTGVSVESINITDQIMTLNFEKLYPDDLIALTRDMISELVDADPSARGVGFSLEAIHHLSKAILALDKRAVERHGYSFSPSEKEIPVPKA